LGFDSKILLLNNNGIVLFDKPSPSDLKNAIILSVPNNSHFSFNDFRIGKWLFVNNTPFFDFLDTGYPNPLLSFVHIDNNSNVNESIDNVIFKHSPSIKNKIYKNNDKNSFLYSFILPLIILILIIVCFCLLYFVTKFDNSEYQKLKNYYYNFIQSNSNFY